MKIINRDISDFVTSDMSDSQIRSRRNKSVRNHIWVLKSVITEALSKKSKTLIDVQVMFRWIVYVSPQFSTFCKNTFPAKICKFSVIQLVLMSFYCCA